MRRASRESVMVSRGTPQDLNLTRKLVDRRRSDFGGAFGRERCGRAEASCTCSATCSYMMHRA